ncbi:hypothetical protein KVA01_15120 [Kocuria varians]|uniref:Uncharacterized protein n=1 Tax=Kocuria varians TaxID=1272 RepID=A0A4Y4D7T0_KOCVA|nr:hypothetical protein [Kocuria varians]GEC99357.1 hypothetical protein KVA01_15120 [Kocuria varians]
MKHLVRCHTAVLLLLGAVLPALFTRPGAGAPGHGENADHPDRGDVPGWVMLTLMSAVLVAGLLLIARPALEGLFQDAIDRVSGL